MKKLILYLFLTIFVNNLSATIKEQLRKYIKSELKDFALINEDIKKMSIKEILNCTVIIIPEVLLHLHDLEQFLENSPEPAQQSQYKLIEFYPNDEKNIHIFFKNFMLKKKLNYYFKVNKHLHENIDSKKHNPANFIIPTTLAYYIFIKAIENNNLELSEYLLINFISPNKKHLLNTILQSLVNDQILYNLSLQQKLKITDLLLRCNSKPEAKASLYTDFRVFLTINKLIREVKQLDQENVKNILKSSNANLMIERIINSSNISKFETINEQDLISSNLNKNNINKIKELIILNKDLLLMDSYTKLKKFTLDKRCTRYFKLKYSNKLAKYIRLRAYLACMLTNSKKPCNIPLEISNQIVSFISFEDMQTIIKSYGLKNHLIYILKKWMNVNA